CCQIVKALPYGGEGVIQHFGRGAVGIDTSASKDSRRKCVSLLIHDVGCLATAQLGLRETKTATAGQLPRRHRNPLSAQRIGRPDTLRRGPEGGNRRASGFGCARHSKRKTGSSQRSNPAAHQCSGYPVLSAAISATRAVRAAIESAVNGTPRRDPAKPSAAT